MTRTAVDDEGNGATAALAAFVADTRFEDLDAAVVADAKRLVLDSIACAVGGTIVDPGNMTVELARELGGPPESTIVGCGPRVSAAAAAFANAYLGNVLDADDTLVNRGHHAVATVFPALALAERRGASGRDLITAVAVGYELGARVLLSITWPMVPPSSTHPETRNQGLGYIGLAAASAASRMLGLDAGGVTNALGIAGWVSPIPTSARWAEFTSPKPMLKYAPYGFLSQQGVLAAQLAAKGFTGDPSIFDGERGYWSLHGARACDWAELTGELGERWWLNQVSIKAYALGGFAKFAVDLFRQLVAEHGLHAGEMERVVVKTIPAVSGHWFNHPPKSQVDLAFNLPFAIAASAYGIELTPSWARWETVRDPRLAAFLPKVEVASNADLTTETGERSEDPAVAKHTMRNPTEVTIEARGTQFQARTDYAFGDPFSPESRMTDEQLAHKFRGFCSGILRSDAIEAVIDVVGRLEDVHDVGRELGARLR